MTSSIRQAVIDNLVAKLKAVKKPTYNFEVGDTRVYDYLALPETVPTPAVFLWEGTEDVDNAVGDRNVRTLEIVVGFVDSYNGLEPTKRARDFLSDIQKAIGSQFVLNVPLQSGGTGNTTVLVRERSNVLNGGGPLQGRIYGQVVYGVDYRTYYLDPSKH